MTKIKAFSLIELLTVVAIISILATIGIGSYTTAVKKGRDAKQKSDVHTTQQALLLYRADHGKYPLACEGGASCDGATALQVLVNEGYLNKLYHRTGPSSLGEYGYRSRESGKKFTFCSAILEYPQNSANSTTNAAEPNFTPCVNDGTAAKANCKYYCVTNP